jgi:hypothetical protein
MTNSYTEPIWDQTHDVELPPLDNVAFTEYGEAKFNETGRPIQGKADEYLVLLT